MTRIMILLCSLAMLNACKQKNSGDSSIQNITKNDTVLIKTQNELAGFNVDYMIKSCSYYWLNGKDTGNISITAYTRKSDSSLHFVVHHAKPVLFSNVLHLINKCIPEISKDFPVSAISAVYFKEPIFYPDLAEDYAKKFGRKMISYKKLSQFLLQSPMTVRLNQLLHAMHKKISGYSIEKFHLLDKQHYQSYLPGENLSLYPDFSIHGLGLYADISAL